MKIFKPEQINEIVNSLQNGQVLVLPSESSYGFSCDATNQSAVDKIFQIKGRDNTKSVLILVDSIAMAQQYLKWNDEVDRLAKKYWLICCQPPLTVVGGYSKGEENGGLARGVISAQNTIAIRVTQHPLLKEICRQLGRPIVSTSANLSGADPIYDSQKIIKQFFNQEFAPAAVVDAGVLPAFPPSTLVSVLNNEIKILRQGGLKLE